MRCEIAQDGIDTINAMNAKRPPIEVHNFVDERISFEQRTPARIHHPGKARVREAVLQAGN